MNRIKTDDFQGFQKENLFVDFIGFNLVNLDSDQIFKLASYFQQFGFNSYQKETETRKSSQPIKIVPKSF